MPLKNRNIVPLSGKGAKTAAKTKNTEILTSKLSLNVQNIYIKTFVFYVILLTLNVAEYRTNENHSAKYYLR